METVILQAGFRVSGPACKETNAANVNFFGNSPVGCSVSLTQRLLAEGNVMHLVIAQLAPADTGTFTRVVGLTLSGTSGSVMCPCLAVMTVMERPAPLSGEWRMAVKSSRDGNLLMHAYGQRGDAPITLKQK